MYSDIFTEKQLQMIISSKSKCGRVGSDTVTSLINFKCDSSASEGLLNAVSTLQSNRDVMQGAEHVY